MVSGLVTPDVIKFFISYVEGITPRDTLAYSKEVHRHGKFKERDEWNCSLHVWLQVHEKYPDIEYSETIVDNACMQLVKNPAQFDVLVSLPLLQEARSHCRQSRA